MSELLSYLHRSITLTNDRGAWYKGILRAILPNGDAMMEVAAIKLTGCGANSTWQELKRVEMQVVTGPRPVEEQHLKFDIGRTSQ